MIKSRERIGSASFVGAPLFDGAADASLSPGLNVSFVTASSGFGGIPGGCCSICAVEGGDVDAEASARDGSLLGDDSGAVVADGGLDLIGDVLGVTCDPFGVIGDAFDGAGGALDVADADGSCDVAGGGTGCGVTAARSGRFGRGSAGGIAAGADGGPLTTTFGGGTIVAGRVVMK
jgi:hypothetical protein